MENSKHSPDEISVHAEITERGIKASAKSRFLSALDRLGGSVADFFYEPVEGKNEKARLRRETERKLIEAATEAMLSELSTNKALAAKLVQRQLTDAARKQLNREGVLQAALDDLSRDPPVNANNSSETPQLDPDFLTRLERYAEDAESDKLREKWGRVLAAEIRQPGTCTNRAMRVLDELDQDTALLFERICEDRVGPVLPKAILKDFHFVASSTLLEAGLIADTGLGLMRDSKMQQLRNGTSVWLIQFDDFAVVIPEMAWTSAVKRMPSIFANPNSALVKENGRPVIPVEGLTAVGRLVASILPDKQEVAFGRLIGEIQSLLPEAKAYRRSDAAGRMDEFDPKANPVSSDV